MTLVYLLDVRERDGRCATAHVDFRSGRPVSEQADAIVHAKLGRILCDWWEFGPHHGSLTMRGDSPARPTYAMRFDLRHYLSRDMVAKSETTLLRWLRFELDGPSCLHPQARLHAQEIGRGYHAWNNDPRPARIEDDVTLPDGTVRTVCMDLRPWLNNVLHGEELEADQAPHEAQAR